MFICPGCKTQFRLNTELRIGNVKCPKCGTVSPIQQSDAGPAELDQLITQDPSQSQLAPGTKIAGHKIIAHLGTDAITVRYKAMQMSMGRTVIFNLLRANHAGNENVRSKFFAEARSIARLSHPNLQSVFDMGEQ